MRTSFVVTIACVAMVGGMVGCRTGDDAVAGPVAEPLTQSTTSPEGYVDKHERLRRALEGLNFDSGLVEIVAEARWRYADRHDPQRAIERYQDGLQLLEQNARTAAVAAMKEAILLAPELAVPYDGLGMALITKGEDDYAMASFRTALRIDEELIGARFHLADALGRVMRVADSIEQYQRVLDMDPAYLDANSRVAVAHYYQGNYDDAWRYVHAANDAGQSVQPQFIPLLSAKMPDPRR